MIHDGVKPSSIQETGAQARLATTRASKTVRQLAPRDRAVVVVTPALPSDPTVDGKAHGGGHQIPSDDLADQCIAGSQAQVSPLPGDSTVCGLVVAGGKLRRRGPVSRS